jgi:outer membrane protein assembly factor BamD
MNLSSMQRRFTAVVLLSLVLVLATACTNKRVSNPLAKLDSKQPDKVLFDRAEDALKHNKFEVARLSLQTLINTYPDSEYMARAKLGVADSWYAEGGTAALSQAEIEYKDFQTFFPNMLAEASEAQYKVANIHYQEMEKPDRDFTHALRAEDELRQMILQYPDSPLLPKAKERLLEVQEVLGEREFRVGRFYYMRESYPAAQARLRSLTDKYPLYSKADEGLYLLGQSYEGQIARIRAMPAGKADAEQGKARAIQEFTKNAAEAYSQIVKRYPAGLRGEDAKQRLAELHQPVPQPTPEAIALNKKEIESRGTPGMKSMLLDNFRRHPDTEEATRVGEPTLVDPQMVSATDVARATAQAFAPATGSSTVSVETVKGAPGPNEAAPRSDTPPSDKVPAVDPSATPNTTPANTSGGTAAAPVEPSAYGELKPDTAPANAAPASEAPPPAPAQTNEIQPAGATDNKPPDSVNQAPAATPNNSSSSSSSKKKKKSKKVFPF